MNIDEELDYRIRRTEQLAADNERINKEFMNEISVTSELIKLKLDPAHKTSSKIQDYSNPKKSATIKSLFKMEETKLIAVYMAVTFAVFALSILLEGFYIR